MHQCFIHASLEITLRVSNSNIVPTRKLNRNQMPTFSSKHEPMWPKLGLKYEKKYVKKKTSSSGEITLKKISNNTTLEKLLSENLR